MSRFTAKLSWTLSETGFERYWIVTLSKQLYLKERLAKMVFYTVLFEVSFRNLRIWYSTRKDEKLISSLLVSCWLLLLTYYRSPWDYGKLKRALHTQFSKTPTFNSDVRRDSVTKQFSPPRVSQWKSSTLYYHPKKKAGACTRKSRNKKERARTRGKIVLHPKMFLLTVLSNRGFTNTLAWSFHVNGL